MPEKNHSFQVIHNTLDVKTKFISRLETLFRDHHFINEHEHIFLSNIIQSLTSSIVNFPRTHSDNTISQWNAITHNIHNIKHTKKVADGFSQNQSIQILWFSFLKTLYIYIYFFYCRILLKDPSLLPSF